MLRIKKPATIVADWRTPKVVTLVFDVTEEADRTDAAVIMQLHVDWTNLVDSDKKQFKIRDGLTLPTFAFEGRQSLNEQKNKREHIGNMKEQQDKEVKVKELEKNVTCLCVHGTCLDG